MIDIEEFINIFASTCMSKVRAGGAKIRPSGSILSTDPKNWVRFAISGHPVPEVDRVYKFKVDKRYCYDPSGKCQYSGETIAFTNAYCVTRVNLSNPDHDVQEMWLSSRSFGYLSLLV